MQDRRNRWSLWYSYRDRKRIGDFAIYSTFIASNVLRSVKKLLIQCTIHSGTRFLRKLCSKRWWDTVSNAPATSMLKNNATLSFADPQTVCICSVSSSSAASVDLLGRPPTCVLGISWRCCSTRYLRTIQLDGKIICNLRLVMAKVFVAAGVEWVTPSFSSIFSVGTEAPSSPKHHKSYQGIVRESSSSRRSPHFISEVKKKKLTSTKIPFVKHRAEEDETWEWEEKHVTHGWRGSI